MPLSWVRRDVVYGADAMGVSLVAVHLAGVYAALPLTVAGTELPMFTALITAPLLLLRNEHRIASASWNPLAAIAAVALMTIFLAPQPTQYFFDRFKGLVQFMFSLACAYALVLELSAWRRDQLERLCRAGVIVILVGCLLENYAGLRTLSNQFRDIAFPAAKFQFLERDIEIAGFERPRLFTSEPSDVAKFLVLMSFGWIALSRSVYRQVICVSLALLGLWLIRSPIVVLLVPLQLAIALWGRPLLPPRQLITVGLLALSGVVLATVAVAAMAPLVAGRFVLATGGGDLSSVIRIVTPVLIALGTLQSSPAFGAGISGSESIAGVILHSYELTGMEQLALASLDMGSGRLANEITNSFWLLWINFGLVGGLLLLYALGRWFAAVGSRRRMLSFAALFLFSQTMGAMHGPYFWSYIALIAAVIAHIDEVGPVEMRAIRSEASSDAVQDS